MLAIFFFTSSLHLFLSPTRSSTSPVRSASTLSNRSSPILDSPYSKSSYPLYRPFTLIPRNYTMSLHTTFSTPSPQKSPQYKSPYSYYYYPHLHFQLYPFSIIVPPLNRLRFLIYIYIYIFICTIYLYPPIFLSISLPIPRIFTIYLPIVV